ncbi:hypothetical protein GCM10010276_20870 [Streptomyces longisporus]|uniref:Uncharacterized protein n=1 Tax=Streptomyces longisporus TaxID=1948 RepID=A0ABN3LIA8_STRLO
MFGAARHCGAGDARILQRLLTVWKDMNGGPALPERRVSASCWASKASALARLQSDCSRASRRGGRLRQAMTCGGGGLPVGPREAVLRRGVEWDERSSGSHTFPYGGAPRALRA